jgi:DNA-binding NarL/FixJ family response regulator
MPPEAPDQRPLVRVLLVDDHALVRGGLAALLGSTNDLEVAGQASDGAQAVAAVESARPDVVLMDLSMPVLDGVEATRRIHAAHPELPVVVLTSFADAARVDDALVAGAVGYLLKDCEPAELLAGVRAAGSQSFRR